MVKEAAPDGLLFRCAGIERAIASASSQTGPFAARTGNDSTPRRSVSLSKVTYGGPGMFALAEA